MLRSLDLPDHRAIAAAVEQEAARLMIDPPAPQGDMAEHPTNSEDGPRVVQRPAGINARMLEAIQANPEVMGWNSSQWAKHLKCAKSSVVETQTWKDLSIRRDRHRAERARDRRRRPKGSEQRPD
jgi:hypothetical protein